MLCFQVYDNVMKGISEQSALTQKVFHYAMGISRDMNSRLEFGKPVSAWLAFKHKWVDKIVLSKIRDKLGGRLT
jgi:long-chain acyl-CoA synthetase